jgi:predicted nucleic acid-binding protein
MAGSLFDLNDPTVVLPNRFVVDTNVIVERVFAALILRTPIPDPLQAQQAAGFFQMLLPARKAGIVTPTVYGELVHVVIGYFLKQFGLRRTPRMDRLQVYKRFPGYIKTLEPILQQLRFFLVTSGLLVISPDELEPIDPATTFDGHLIELCCDYGLDTADAMILFEAERLGIGSIVTMDGDIQRASADFDIYTWI